MKRDATWRELLSLRLDRDDQDVIRLFRALLESLDTPVSLGAHLRLKYLGVGGLLEMSINPSDYNCPRKFADDYQVVKFLAKYPFKNSPFDTKAEAINTSKRGEARCKVENEFWEAYEQGCVDLRPDLEEILIRAKSIIDETLGTLPVQEWLDSCRFGPGTFAYSEVTKPSDAVKLSTNPSVTLELVPYLQALCEEFPGWFRPLTLDGITAVQWNVVPGGKHTTVPKTAKTDRNIETQPLLNLFLQLGLGQCIRRRLLDRWGLKLERQSDENRELARKGSIFGSYATIDLSNASDTISRGLVRQLLPADWYHALDLTRTHKFEFEGEFLSLERFSAMGNGFTFELETLIFFALARAASPHGKVVSYGDDIIVPTMYAGKVCGVLESCGFTVNRSKSYTTGPFRESCGADWFLGHYVRPFFLDNEVKHVTEVVSAANGLARWALHRNRGSGFDYRVRRAWLHAVRWIPPRIRARLAWGYPEGDEYLFAWKVRGDRQIHAVTRTQRLESWHTARSTALYRVHARRIRDEEVTGRQAPLSVPARESQTWKFVPLDPCRLRDWGCPQTFAVERVVLECGWC